MNKAKKVCSILVFILLLPGSVRAMIDTSSAELQLPIQHLITLRLKGAGWILDANQSFQNTESLVSLLEIAETDQNTDFVLYKAIESQDRLVFTRFNLESGNKFTMYLIVQWSDMLEQEEFIHKDVSVISILPVDNVNNITGYLAEANTELPVQNQVAGEEIANRANFANLEEFSEMEEISVVENQFVDDPELRGSTGDSIIQQVENTVTFANEENEISAAIDSLEEFAESPDLVNESLATFIQKIDTYAQNKQTEEGRKYGLEFLESIENYSLQAEGYFLLAQFLEQNSSSVQDIQYALDMYRLVIMDFNLSKQYKEAFDRIRILENKYFYLR